MFSPVTPPVCVSFVDADYRTVEARRSGHMCTGLDPREVVIAEAPVLGAQSGRSGFVSAHHAVRIEENSDT